MIRYTWYVSFDLIQRKRLTLIKALFNGFAKTPQMRNERIPITREQADKIVIGFNFKGK